MAGVKQFIALVVILVAIGGKWVGAQVHHVVGGDRGWDPSSDVGSWSSGRIFRVGDKILAIGGKWVEAQLHHVVGGDHGWDPSLDVPSWTSGRIFRVGDQIWFAYSAAQESILELGSVEEYLSCDLSNPIRMYTEGLDRVALDGEGVRYFASGKHESCKNGLKLHVDVQPRPDAQKQHEIQKVPVAAGPTTPSASSHLTAVSNYVVLFLGLLLC